MEERTMPVQEGEGPRLAYAYRPDTGEFVSVAFPQQHAGNWLLPGNCTWQKPPELQERQVAIFDSVECNWAAKADYRGIPYWHKQTHEQFTIQEIDCFPDEAWTDQDPAKIDLFFTRFDDDKQRWVFNQEAKDQAEAVASAAEADRYLKATDWQVIRAFEKKMEVPNEVLLARDLAREKIDQAEILAPGTKVKLQGAS
jgi:hypothetical protein